MAGAAGERFFYFFYVFFYFFHFFFHFVYHVHFRVQFLLSLFFHFLFFFQPGQNNPVADKKGNKQAGYQKYHHAGAYGDNPVNKIRFVKRIIVKDRKRTPPHPDSPPQKNQSHRADGGVKHRIFA